MNLSVVVAIDRGRYKKYLKENPVVENIPFEKYLLMKKYKVKKNRGEINIVIWLYLKRKENLSFFVL